MKTTIFFLALCLLATGTLFSQTTNNLETPTSVRADGLPPDASAILDVQSSTQGMRLPNMTTGQRDAIASPAPGLLIYNTTDSCFNYYSGSSWLKDCGRSLTADTQPPLAIQGGGAGGSEGGTSVATDASGNVFVTGRFYGTATFGSETLTSAGNADVYTVKYDAGGNVLWAKQGGGTSSDTGTSVATDASGNVFVTGFFAGTATFGSETLTSAGNNDVFTVKYDASGTVLWARQGGSTGPDNDSRVATDASGNVFVTGFFAGTATFGSETLTSAGNNDVFTVKYDASGTVLWARQDGDTDNEFGFGIATDASGNVFVTGRFEGTATFGSETLTSAGGWDVFTVKYDASGTVLWARQDGGSNTDWSYGVATDASGNVFVTGPFYGTATFGSETLTSAGNADVYTVKYDATGTVLWARQGGGTGPDNGYGVATDASGNVFVTGSFRGTATFGSETLTSAGNDDVFTVKYDATGTVLWARQGGGTDPDNGRGVATDASGNVFVTGYFWGTATFGSEALTSAGGSDMFLVAYSAAGGQSIPVNGLSGSQDNDGDPTNELQDWGNLPGIPTAFSDGTDDVDDADADPTNELLTSATLNGTDLEITDAGGTATVDLSGLSPAETDPEVGANTLNYLPKWDGAALVASTAVQEDGTGHAGVNQAYPNVGLNVRGLSGELVAFRAEDDAGNERFQVFNDGHAGVNQTYSEIALNVRGLSGEIFVFNVEDDAGTERFRVRNDGHVGVNNTYDDVAFNVQGISGDPLAFNVDDDAGTERFTVQNGGNVGIGLLSPETKLHVNGNIRADGGGEYQSWGPISLHPDMNLSGDDVIMFLDSDGNENARVHSNGNVGIGTLSPGAKLEVSDGTTGLQIRPGMLDAAADPDWTTLEMEGNKGLRVWDDFSVSGKAGIGRIAATNQLEVEGDASKSSAGDWLANSDARLKTNIRPLDSEAILQKMLALRGVTYEWNDDMTGSQRPEGTMYGFTAQNIQAVFPELVTEDNLGFLQTAYGTYDAMTVEAIRALADRIGGLYEQNLRQQAEIESLQSKLSEMDELKSRMATLETALLQLTSPQGGAGED